MSDSNLKFTEFARQVLDTLEAANIDYLIGGAVAVWAWGEARTTQDFDVVINLPGERIVQLSQELAKRNMLVPPDVIIELLIQPEGDLPIHAIHMDTGYKAELFLLRDGDVYRATALARRRLVDLGPPLGQVYVHAPEDLILNKVHYFSLSEQTKHIRDIASIMLFVGDTLDFVYIDLWVERLDLTASWVQVQERVTALWNNSA